MEDLRDFIGKVKELGELSEIDGADWDLEIGAVTYLAAKLPNPPALLFDRIKDYPPGYRLLAIPYSNDRRIALTLGSPLEASKLELVKILRDRLMEPFEPVPPVEVKNGPVIENVDKGDQIDLFKFPAPRWFSLDGGRHLGAGNTVIVRDPEDGRINVSSQRMQIHDKSVATIFSEPDTHFDVIRQKYWAKGQGCPVAVTCGGHPVFASIQGMGIPSGASAYDWLGWWRKGPVQVIKGPITGLPIVSHAEIALEGEMPPPEIETRLEGPFSGWSGHYSPARSQPVFMVKNALYRNAPIVLAELPFLGREGTNHRVIHVMKSAEVWRMLDALVPGVKGVWVYSEFGGESTVVISIEQKYGGHAKQVAMAALGQLSTYTKFVIVVDEDIDPTSLRHVLWAIGLRSEPEEWETIKGMRSGCMDPRISPRKREADDLTHSTAIIMACKPFHWIKDFPPAVAEDAELEKKVREKWGDQLL